MVKKIFRSVRDFKGVGRILVLWLMLEAVVAIALGRVAYEWWPHMRGIIDEVSVISVVVGIFAAGILVLLPGRWAITPRLYGLSHRSTEEIDRLD